MEDTIEPFPQTHGTLHHPTLNRPKKPVGARRPSRSSLSLRSRADFASVAPLSAAAGGGGGGAAGGGAGAGAGSHTPFSSPQRRTPTKNTLMEDPMTATPAVGGTAEPVSFPSTPSPAGGEGGSGTAAATAAPAADRGLAASASSSSTAADASKPKKKSSKWFKVGKSKDSGRIGHRKVDRETGEVAYKQVKSSTLMGAIQMGVRQAVGGDNSKPSRDLLLKDFDEVESCAYPPSGSQLTPPHRFESFKFYNYAPKAFRYFRQAFGIDTSDFLLSLCDEPLRELSNPGASGSVFYLSHDDVFIIKTVQKGEHKFLRKLLPGYYMNLVQNKRTLLPKFFGLFQYQSSLGRNIRFVVMNNLLPSRLTYYQQYDLKGSTFKRFANERELRKRTPTLKDLDFNSRHPAGLYMDPDTYERLSSTIRRDCTVLESFKIMDYSLLVGVHNTQIDSDVAPPSKDSREADLYSAHQRSIQKNQKFPDNTTHCLFREASAKQPLLIQGARSAASAANGFYDLQMDEPFEGRRCFRLRTPIEDQEWVRTHRSSLLFVFFDHEGCRWCLAPAPGSSDVIMFVKGDTVSPEFCLGPWEIVVGEASPTADAAVRVTLLRQATNDATSALGTFSALAEGGGESRFNLSMQDQLDTSDEETNDGSRSPVPTVENPHGGLVAYTESGDKVVIFIGIIDILQNYATRKMLEHSFKSVLHDGDTVSVHKPSFYSRRFQNFMLERVFQPMQFSARADAGFGRGNSGKRALSFRRSKYPNTSKPKPKSSEATKQPHRSPSLVRRDLAHSWGRADSVPEDLVPSTPTTAGGVTISVTTPPPLGTVAEEEGASTGALPTGSTADIAARAGASSPRVVMVNSLRQDDEDDQDDDDQALGGANGHGVVVDDDCVNDGDVDSSVGTTGSEPHDSASPVMSTPYKSSLGGGDVPVGLDDVDLGGDRQAQSHGMFKQLSLGSDQDDALV
eukprot:m.71236 g.71236  ORF g.71236 m.71236 type:complete len:961 (+) comp14148_c1_seq1:899-3781(+)